MWADSKTLYFFKFGSMVQKLFEVEKLHMRHFLHCYFGDNGADDIFKHRITVEPLKQFSKIKVFWNLPTLGQHIFIFNYLINLININDE